MRIVDLFSGCGALSLGITEACRALSLNAEHVFASDINPAALDVYKRNFPSAMTSGEPAETLVGRVGMKISAQERQLQAMLGHVDILAGGPPCQGHSDLNNHTRRSDPRNSLFDVMIRFAQLLSPKHVIIENVPGVRHDVGGVTENGKRALIKLGYSVSEAVLTASEFGAAQRRKRYVLVATRNTFHFDALPRMPVERTLRWAVEDLMHLSSDAIIDSYAASSKVNRDRIDYLFDHDLHDLPNEMRPPCHRLKNHSYNAVYGRLRWDIPAPTITSGFNSPGQGRFIHPAVRRTLTPHEAARIQSIPDFFDWGNANREALTQMIGNAVPPKLAYRVALEILR
ncbi:DNA cytosine methyltransferase [Acidovorax sp.]|uniref:DNA cytosine methyltransferase n=1 Tax=Acidovorax sp. TaxID=1872122 RepID=UPI003D07BFEB